MPRALTNIRIATSLVTHEGGATPTEQEIDFQLAVREAIEIFAVIGILNDLGNVAAGTTQDSITGMQTLQAEEDNPRDVGHQTTDTDTVILDDEVIFMQGLVHTAVEDDTNHTDSASTVLSPNGPVVYPIPLVEAFNLHHTIVTEGTALDFVGTLMIHYRYVELSSAETVGVFARRR